jgi:hypothetical protein
MALLYNIPHLKLMAYDTRSLINRNTLLTDFNRLPNKYHAQMVFEFNQSRKRFDIVEEDTNVRPMNPHPYLVLCGHSLQESMIDPAQNDRVEVHIRRRIRSYRERWSLPRPFGISADMHSITCINASNIRNNLYRIADVQKELSPGYMFLATEPRATETWCLSEMELLDPNDEGIEDTVSISFYKNNNHS